MDGLCQDSQHVRVVPSNAVQERNQFGEDVLKEFSVGPSLADIEELAQHLQSVAPGQVEHLHVTHH